MFLMYIDESGDTGLTNSPTDYFILSGLVVHELRWNQFLNDLISFRRDLRNTLGLKLRDEIHSVAFINRPKDLKRIPRNQRLLIMRLCLDWVANQPDVSIITVVVNKINKPQGYDVFSNAWEAIIQRFENTIRHKNFPGPSNPDERGLILPDNTDGEKLRKLLRKMRRFNFIPSQIGLPPRNMLLNYVIEDPFLKDSHQSFTHQLIDVIAYSARQLYEPNAYMRKKGGTNFYQRLDPVLCKVASKKHSLGIVEL